MKYIIMCGGEYRRELPKQLLKIMGERIIERTIRLLRAYGVKDIAISATNYYFDCLSRKLNVPILVHDNDYIYGHEENHRWLSFLSNDRTRVLHLRGCVLLGRCY